MNAAEIRQKFLDFFKERGHLIVPSAPMVVKNDPTLMFNNSGMAQFKEYFLGNAEPKSPRIADTQKCLRVSGKHNDLEDVGFDTYHHTMFEMLGNWSFGDYFKKEAIHWAWELLTEVYKINKDQLYVTVFEGSPEENVPFDQESYDIWKALVPEERILLGNKKDNFWEMGDQGPCGPCSEIHVDIRDESERTRISGRELVNKDHPQVVEIWNNVFMEFNRKADGSLEKLPAQHVDTGMGFERLCMVLQGKQSNYDTDVFTPLIREIEAITGTTYGASTSTDVAIRVIADHVRAVAFAIADGQLPSNTGAGYVIRRILRRAIRYGFTFLNVKEPFIYKLVAVLSQQMGEFFPEIKSQATLVTQVIKEEEASFLRTLEQGLLLLDQVVAQTQGKVVSGDKVFELYDTFGFPVDLTALILREKGMTHDDEAFQTALQKQKERSRAATKTTTGDWEVIYEDAVQEFVGYDMTEVNVKITRYRKVVNQKEGELYQLVFNLTPFYPEGGGQVGDQGYIESDNGEVIYIIDTKKENNVIVHFVKNLPTHLTGSFKAIVNETYRKNVASNHTATHLMHQALRMVLGTHVEQKGSLVSPKYLRFDFSHFAKVTDEELMSVQEFVNARIAEGLPLEEKRNMVYDQAIAEGAIALFGEKYGDTVRAIRFGQSMELCGGTHATSTADLWQFIITSESAVASGVRRIEAITKDAAKSWLLDRSKQLDEVKTALKNPQDVQKAVHQLVDEHTQLKKQVEQLMKEKALQTASDLNAKFTSVNGVSLLVTRLELDAASVKDIAFDLGSKNPNAFILIGSVFEGKPMLTCYIDKNLVQERGLNAGQVVKTLGQYIQGGGGGQPFFATAGGKKPEGIDQALEAVHQFLG